MSGEQKKTLPKIRTFAKDVEEQRAKTGQPLPATISVPKAPIPTITVSAKKPEVRKETTKPTSVHIPAFHELQKNNVVHSDTPATTAHSTPSVAKGPTIKVASTQRSDSFPTSTKKVSVRAKRRADLQKPISVSGGTIITDTKNTNPNFLSEFVKSIDDWFQSVIKSFQKKPAPKYTIVDTERRKGVIQKATSKTGTIFTADNETLRDEIRRRNQSQRRVDTEPDISWSPNIEAGYALLEAPEVPKPAVRPETISVTFKQRSVPPPIIVEPSVQKPIIPDPAPVVIPPPAPVVPVYVPPAAPTQTLPTTTEVVPILPEIGYSETEPLYEAAPVVETPKFSFTIRSVRDLIRLNTNFLTLGITGILGLLVILFIVVRVLVGVVVPDITIATIPATPFNQNAPIKDVVLSSISEEGVATALLEHKEESLGTTEIRFIDSAGVPLPTQSLLPLLGFKANQNLNQAVTEVHMAYVDTKRVLLLKVTDSKTVFGSFLAWEPTIARDLSSTLLINGTTDDARFIDKTFGKNDVRILEIGSKQVLVYGFIDENTVAITPDTGAFETLLGSQ